jgi:hypothetical protein
VCGRVSRTRTNCVLVFGLLCLFLIVCGISLRAIVSEVQPVTRGAVASGPLTPVGLPQPDGSGRCVDTEHAASRFALTVYETCHQTFALQPLCTPPMAFPPSYPADHQAAVVEKAYSDCGLSPGELVVDCYEFPCVAMMTRDTIRRRQSNCERLAQMSRDIDMGSRQGSEMIEMDSSPLSGWVTDVPDVPSDPFLYTAMKARFPARAVVQARRFGEATSVPAQTDCEIAHQALEDLAGADPCAAVRSYWGCEEDTVVDRETYGDYVAHAEAVLDDLLDTCPHTTPENTRLDCSGAPCLLLVDAPGLSRNEAVCHNDNVFSFTGTTWYPDLKIGVLYPSKHLADQAHVGEQFEASEKVPRAFRLMDEWLAR